jgi:hypothetical protein
MTPDLNAWGRRMAIEDTYRDSLATYRAACDALRDAGPADRARLSEAQIRAGWALGIAFEALK